MSRASLAVRLASFALVLAACGGSEDGTGAAGAPATTTTPETTVEQNDLDDATDNALETPATEGTVEEGDQAAFPDQGAVGRVLGDLFGLSPEEVAELSEEESDSLLDSLDVESIEEQMGVGYILGVLAVGFGLSLVGQEECPNYWSDPDAFVNELAPEELFKDFSEPIPELDGLSVVDVLDLTVEEVRADMDFAVSETCSDLEAGESK